MPRSFTITFTHNKKEYLAVVSRMQNDVCVYVPDESLHEVLPQGKFSYDPGRGLNVDATLRSRTQSLMLDVLTAIELKTQTLSGNEA